MIIRVVEFQSTIETFGVQKYNRDIRCATFKLKHERNHCFGEHTKESSFHWRSVSDRESWIYTSVEVLIENTKDRIEIKVSSFGGAGVTSPRWIAVCMIVIFKYKLSQKLKLLWWNAVIQVPNDRGRVSFCSFQVLCCSTWSRIVSYLHVSWLIHALRVLGKRVGLAWRSFRARMQPFLQGARRGKDRASWSLYCKRVFEVSGRLINKNYSNAVDFNFWKVNDRLWGRL